VIEVDSGIHNQENGRNGQNALKNSNQIVHYTRKCKRKEMKTGSLN